MGGFKTILQYLRKQRGLSQQELAKALGLAASTIGMYETGKRKPSFEILELIADFFNVDMNFLLGKQQNCDQNSTESLIAKFDNIFPIEKHKIPLLGEISCGKPIFANEDMESYIEIGADINADFCLKAHGDSMINARILDGDIVFIRKQEMVENGEIAAVIIDDEATLKRVYYEKDKGKLVLQAENPGYAPLVYVGDELNSIHILGKAVAFQSDVK